jgi:tetratricopeptide (TPR) repeat protein
VALDPGNSEIRQGYARNLLAPIGLLAEARAGALLATRLDPLSNSAWTSLAAIHLAEGDLDRARQAASRSLELRPKQDFPATYLALVELLEGRPEQALQAAQQCAAELFRLQLSAVALHDLGRRAESQVALDQLIARHATQGPVPDRHGPRLARRARPGLQVAGPGPGGVRRRAHGPAARPAAAEALRRPTLRGPLLQAAPAGGVTAPLSRAGCGSAPPPGTSPPPRARPGRPAGTRGRRTRRRASARRASPRRSGVPG